MLTTLTSMLMSNWLGMPAFVWLSFIILVLVVLALDLGVFHRSAHEVSLRESTVLAGCCLTLGFSFSFVVWWLYYKGLAVSLDDDIANAGSDVARAWTAWELYLTGWLVEQTLSLDNIFVMSMIFAYFSVPSKYQHRVLFYGILGVIILRAIMIGVGAALVHRFDWILYLFSAFLVFTGIKMLMMTDAQPDLENNRVLQFLRRNLRVTTEIKDERFIIKKIDPKTGRLVRHVTPLFLALLLIELADVIFAVDSVPAIFAITQDPFIVYTSNIFAILGLRSLYFVLAAIVHRFHHLKYALSIVLIYIGAKIFVQPFIGKIPPEVSLIVTFGLLCGGIVVSLFKSRRKAQAIA